MTSNVTIPPSPWDDCFDWTSARAMAAHYVLHHGSPAPSISEQTDHLMAWFREERDRVPERAAVQAFVSDLARLIGKPAGNDNNKK